MFLYIIKVKRGGQNMKKKLVKPKYKAVCPINLVLAFDEGITDAGITGFNF